MLKKMLLISLVILGLVAGSAVAAEFTPKYDREAECFMSLDYLDYMGPAPTIWFVDQATPQFGRNYIRQEGDVWRTRNGYKDEVVKVFAGRTAMDAWLCPEMVLAAVTPPPPALLPLPKTFIVYFDFDKSVIKKDQVHVLEEAVQYAQESGFSQIQLASFCDFRGSVDYNAGLSKRRSTAVQHWLIENGMGTDAFSVEDNGKLKSLVRALKGKYCATCWEDRRVEITLE